ncbi:MAG: hypothetical protein K2Q06_02045, partial [Parvularculaceae bacterium]|nr:hypothetical protein [Parvularculaceae bacterium]
MTGSADEKAARRRWRQEMTASWLAAAVARRESDPAKRKLFGELAAEGAGQADLIARALPAAPAFRPSLRTRITAGLISAFGPRAVRPVLAASKVRGLSVYNGPLRAGHLMPTTVA